MTKIEDFTQKVIDLLTEANIPTFAESQKSSAQNLPEYIVIEGNKFSITNMIRFDGGLAFDSTLFCKLTVFYDKECVKTSDLALRAISVISKNRPADFKGIRSEVGENINKHIVDLEIGGFGWVQFDD